MYRFSEFKCKEIINSRTGVRMGFADDVFFDLESGKISSFSVPAQPRFLFFSGECYMIPFGDIERIGDDVIIVSAEPRKCSTKSERSFWERLLSWFK